MEGLAEAAVQVLEMGLSDSDEGINMLDFWLDDLWKPQCDCIGGQFSIVTKQYLIRRNHHSPHSEIELSKKAKRTHGEHSSFPKG